MAQPRGGPRRYLTDRSRVVCHDFRTDINGLRGISVAMVVGYHLQAKGAGGDFIGVDVFFVIAGFLITRIIWHGLAEDQFSLWRFIAARAARIWPALAALVLRVRSLASVSFIYHPPAPQLGGTFRGILRPPVENIKH